MNSFRANDINDILSNILGKPITTHVRGLIHPDIPIYIFNKYNISDKSRIEAQVGKFLKEGGLISIYPHRLIWLDIRNILFCESFLMKDNGDCIFNENVVSIKKTHRCWELLDKSSLTDYFNHQWKVLERIAYWRINKKEKDRLKNKETVKRIIKKYTQVCRDELSFIRKYQPKVKVYLPLSENAGTILSHFVLKEGFDDDFRTKFRGMFHREFREDFIKEFSSKYIGEFKQRKYMPPFRSSSGWWLPQKHLDYYLDLLRYIDKTTVLRLMQDMITDFKKWGSGIPDMLIYNKHNNQAILLECKGPNDKLRDSQLRWLNRNEEYYRFKVGLVVTSKNQAYKL